MESRSTMVYELPVEIAQAGRPLFPVVLSSPIDSSPSEVGTQSPPRRQEALAFVCFRWSRFRPGFGPVSGVLGVCDRECDFLIITFRWCGHCARGIDAVSQLPFPNDTSNVCSSEYLDTTTKQVYWLVWCGGGDWSLCCNCNRKQ